MIKSHKPIKYSKNEKLRYTKLGTDRMCNCCGEYIKINDVALTCDYMIYIHLSCIEIFIEQLKDFKETYSKELIIEMLR